MEPIDDAVHEALAAIRKNPGDSFILCGYEGPETTHFILLGQGQGSAEALSAYVPVNDSALRSAAESTDGKQSPMALCARSSPTTTPRAAWARPT